MADILQLREFFLGRLHLDWKTRNGSDADEDEIEDAAGEYEFHYEILREKSNPRSFALQLGFSLEPGKGGKGPGYAVDSEIFGFFEFPQSMSDEQIQYLVRVNGGMILYGILRGQIAMCTGSFPGGKCLLPAVDMKEEMIKVDARQVAKNKKSTKKNTKKSRAKL